MSVTLTTGPRIKVVEKANANHPGPGGRPPSLAIYEKAELHSATGRYPLARRRIYETGALGAPYPGYYGFTVSRVPAMMMMETKRVGAVP
jgi:hypothetical protein